MSNLGCWLCSYTLPRGSLWHSGMGPRGLGSLCCPWQVWGAPTAHGPLSRVSSDLPKGKPRGENHAKECNLQQGGENSLPSKGFWAKGGSDPAKLGQPSQSFPFQQRLNRKGQEEQQVLGSPIPAPAASTPRR